MEGDKYFVLAKSKQEAIEYWNNSQYDLVDMILAMVDNNIKEGAMIYEAFKTKGFLAMMNVFKFNFELAKKELGIVGEYVERGGNVFDEKYNPKRNPSALTLKKEELQKKAKYVYDQIEDQLKKTYRAIKKKYDNM